MKIALAQLDYHVGNFEANAAKIIKAINEAKLSGVQLIAFSELAICGYPAWDFLEFDDFIAQCEKSIKTIASHCTGIAAIVGGPCRNPLKNGKNLYNSAWFLSEGTVQQMVHKTLLPTYDVFDEYRYFEPNTQFNCVDYLGQKIAVSICEDLWNLSEDPLYTKNPMDFLIKEHPDFAINIAASPFSFSHDASRMAVLRNNAKKYNIPFFYVNHTGAQTELIFDGASMVVHPDGSYLKMSFFEEEIRSFDLRKIKEGNFPQSDKQGKYELITQALIKGIQDYFSKMGFKKATLGLSGGIDSAVVFALAVKALGAEQVLPILLPSPYTSALSNNEAMTMVKLLGTAHKIIPIAKVMTSYSDLLNPHFEGLKSGLAEENLQARARGTILMAISNKLDYILLNTSNKSEMAVGYSTLYGDSIGAFSVLGDLYKTEVYELADYINKTWNNCIPELIISRAPSAELRPDQKDSDSLPDYSILDAILYQYIENRKGPDEIIQMGYDATTVHKILKLVNQSEYKRFQAPPILRVSDKAFGIGRRLPIVAKYLA